MNHPRWSPRAPRHFWPAAAPATQASAAQIGYDSRPPADDHESRRSSGESPTVSSIRLQPRRIGRIGVGFAALIAGLLMTAGGPTPPAQAQVATAAGECTSPTFTTSAYQGGTAFGSYYVTNDMGRPISVHQTLSACNYNSWYVDSTMTSHRGQVQTYPNSRITFNNTPELSSFSSLTSDFAESSTPSGSGLVYEYAYDILINGFTGAVHSELMIWNYNSDQTPGGSKVGTTTAGGHGYTVFLGARSASSNGNYIAFVATANYTSGSVNLLGFLKFAASKGWLSNGMSAKLWQVDYGVEISSTNGRPAKFDFTNFDVLANRSQPTRR